MKYLNPDGSEREPDRDAWKQGFQIGSSGGMVCDICRCLVRQDPGSAKVHLEWHERLEGGSGGRHDLR